MPNDAKVLAGLSAGERVVVEGRRDWPTVTGWRTAEIAGRDRPGISGRGERHRPVQAGTRETLDETAPADDALSAERVAADSRIFTVPVECRR